MIIPGIFKNAFCPKGLSKSLKETNKNLCDPLCFWCPGGNKNRRL